MKNKMIKSAFAAVLVMGAVGSAKAQVAGSQGDLVLAFRITDTTNPGVTTNLEYDLGQASNFTTTSTLTFTNLNSDLTADYGSGYNARTDLVWSVAGEVGATGNATLYATSPNTSGPGTGTAFKDASGSTQSGPASKLSAETSTLIGATSTPNNTQASNVSTSNTGSYSNEVGTGNPYNYGNFSSGIENSVSSTTIQTSDLYALKGPTGTKGIDEGTFSLSPDGTFGFVGTAATAAPEPSTYAMLLVGSLGFMVWQYRLRKTSNVG